MFQSDFWKSCSYDHTGLILLRAKKVKKTKQKAYISKYIGLKKVQEKRCPIKTVVCGFVCAGGWGGSTLVFCQGNLVPLKSKQNTIFFLMKNWGTFQSASGQWQVRG